METYEDIYGRMKKSYEETAGFSLDEASDIDIRLRVLAGEIFSAKMYMDFIQRQMFLSTAAGEYLDYHAEERGLSRKEAAKAGGTVTFSVESASAEDILIPEGTVVSTAGEEPLRFITDDSVILYMGNTKASVTCTAEEGGKKYNIKAKEISVLVTPPPGIASVTNETYFKGGSDQESDTALCKRIRDAYVHVSNGSNSAYYKKLAMSVPGVESASVLPGQRGGGTVDIYIGGKGEKASAELTAEVQALIQTQRELNVDVLVQAAEEYTFDLNPVITLEPGYDFEIVKQQCIEALQAYGETLGVGDPILYADASACIYPIEGIRNHRFIGGDTFPGEKMLPVLTAVTVTKGSKQWEL